MTRFLSYNIAGSEDRQARFQEGVEWLLDDIRYLNADVVALQEVYDVTQADLGFLFRLREMGYETVHFGPTIRNPESEYGNLIMARGNPSWIREIDLSVPHAEPRGAIGFSWHHEGRNFEVYATHFGLRRRERGEQLDRLLPWMEEPPPVEIHGQATDQEDGVIRVVMGDFNEWNRFSGLNRAMEQRLGSCPRQATFPSKFPLVALDRIFVSSPLELSLCWKVHREKFRFRSSDHLPLTLDIE